MKERTIRVSLSGPNFYDHLAVVKSCTGRSWDKGKSEWVVPLTDDNIVKLSTIPYLTDKLGIEVERMKLEEKKLNADALALKNEYPFLYDYQAIGSHYAYTKRFYLIADEMGLGKTVQAMPIIDKHAKDGRLVIVLAPKSLLPQWKSEIKRFIDRDAIIVDGTSRKFQRITTYNANMITLSTYESFTRDAKELAVDWANVVIIADEASKFKNVKTHVWRTLNFVRPRVHSFIAMTGTPIENSLHNFFNIITVINPEFITEREFKNQYCEWASNGYGYVITGYKNLGTFLKRVSPIMIRRKKCDVAELPEKVIQNRIIQMSPEQVRIINGIRAYAKASYGTDEAIQALMLLRETADAPCLLYNSSSHMVHTLIKGKWIPPANEKVGPKVEEVMEIIDEAGDDKIIVFTQFKQMARLLCRELVEAGYKAPLLLTGDSSQDERTRGVEDFKAGKYQVMIATEIFGYGMNLQFADVLINFDLPWNPARLNQRIDRIHRLGATRGKIIINLIGEDVEEKVKGVLDSKQDLFDQVVDGKAISDETVRNEILQKLLEN